MFESIAGKTFGKGDRFCFVLGTLIISRDGCRYNAHQNRYHCYCLFSIGLVPGIAAYSIPKPEAYSPPDFKGALEKSLK